MPTTFVVQAGNRGDKLTKHQWRAFYDRMQSIIASYATVAHFHAVVEREDGSPDACWVFDLDPLDVRPLCGRLQGMSAIFPDERIAFTQGSTVFI